jgi:hypothetical protein
MFEMSPWKQDVLCWTGLVQISELLLIMSCSILMEMGKVVKRHDNFGIPDG